MRKKIETRKKFRRICALVVVGMFVAMTPMSVSAQPNPENWSKYGDIGTGSEVLGTINPEPLRIITNGMERIHVTSEGKIGIGTVDPICALHVRDLTPTIQEVGTTIAIESSVSSITPGDPLGTILFIGPYEEGMWGTGAMIRAEASGPFIGIEPNISPTSLQFYTQDATPFNGLVTPRMVITDEGNVGIGTTKPMAKVHIIQDGVVDAFWVDDRANDTTPFVIDQSGNVGIGTTSPNCKLHVIGDANITGSLYAGSLNVDSGALYIDDVNDRVGIGTTDPQYPLEVVGDVYFNCSTFEIGSGTFWYRVGKHTKGSTDNYRIAFDSKNEKENAYFSISAHEEKQNETADETLELVRVLENGNVGIATLNPTQKLHVNGSVRIEEHIFDSNNDQGADNYILRTTATGIDWVDPLDFAVADADWDYGTNSPHMFSLPTGNVGIGETNPSSKLEVNGGVELTNLYDNDGSNFFDGGATASETVTGITSTGQIQTTPISIDESQVSGEIESVTAGDGLTGGGTSGDVTLDVGAGDGIDVFTDTVAVDVTDILGTGLREDSNNIGVYGLMAADGSPTNVVYVADDGKVGVGTTNPLAGLRVATDYGIKVSGTSSPLGNSGVGPEIWYDGTWSIFGAYNRNTGFSQPWRAIGRNFQFFDDTAGAGIRMVIDTQGYVGIGETSPSSKLEVNGDVELTNLYDNDATNFFDGGATASETVTGITSTGQIQTIPISIDESQVSGEIESVTAGDGLTGGGTSGDVTLSHDDTSTQDSVDNSGTTVIQDITLDTYGHLIGVASIDLDDIWINELGDTTGDLTSDLNIDTNTFVISYDDNRVGIGTATPSEKLEVNGNILLSDIGTSSGKIFFGTGTGRGVIMQHPEGGYNAMVIYSVRDITGDPGDNGNLYLNTPNGTSKVIIGRDDQSGTVCIIGGSGYNDNYRLYVHGSAYATGVWASSSRDFKCNIEELSEEDYSDILEKVQKARVVTYNLKENDPLTTKKHIGIIAEEAPDEIVSDDKDAIGHSEYLGFLLAAIKAQQEEIQALKVQIGELENQITTPSP